MKRGRRKAKIKRERLRWLLVFLAIFAAAAVVLGFIEMRGYYQRRESGLYMAENQVKLMDSSLSQTMSRVYTLRMLVEIEDGSTDFFDDVVETLYEETKEDTGLLVKNFILAPGGVVEKIYPLEGNEALVGFDYMDETQAGNKEAVEAYLENKIVVTEPFTLKQGGTGIAARLPVFIDTDDGEEFWGLVAVTLDVDYMLEQFNLDYLKDSGNNYCLWYEGEDGESVVLECSGKTLENPVSVEMDSNNLIWTLDVEPEGGWVPAYEIVAGALICLVLSFLITKLLASRSHIQDMNEVLEELALKDNLTNCYSRHFVNVMLLGKDAKQWKDENACYSLAVIDVDNFKIINDTYGHDVGDKALVALANVIMSFCDELRGDFVVRYGGDEFILLMNHVTRELFEERLEKIIEAVRDIRIEGQPDLRMSVSIGAVHDDSINSYQDLFSQADKLIYQSKTRGKDQYRIEEVSTE